MRPGFLFILLRGEFRSPLSLDEAVQRLKLSTRGMNLMMLGGFAGDGRRFAGRVARDSFTVRRDIFYRAPTVPILVGELREHERKLVVLLHVGFQPIPLLLFLSILTLLFREVPLGAALVDSVLVTISGGLFALETRRSTRLLREILSAE